MKKLLSAALCIALSLCLLAGCGNGDAEPQATPTTSPSPSPEATASQEPTQSTEAAEQKPEDQQATSKPNTSDNSNQASKPQTGNTTQNLGNSGQQSNPGNGQTPSQPQQPSEPQQPAPTQAPVPPASVPVSTIMAKMVGALGSGTHNLTQMPSELYAGVYQIDPAKFEEVLIYGSAMNTRANEIIVIKATDQTNLDQAVSALQNRKANQEKQYQNYLADQYELVKQGTVTTQGLYATLVIAEQSSSAISAFRSAI